MRILVAATIVLLSAQALAQSNQLSPVALGVKQHQDRYFLTLSDFHHFNPNKRDYFGIKRYGIGYSGMDLGEVGSIHGLAANGIPIVSTIEERQGVGFNFSIEPFSGEYSIYTNKAWNNNYMYQPAIAGGIQANLLGFTLITNIKAGYVLTNYFMEEGLWFDQYNMVGYSAYLVFFKVFGLGYDYSRFNNIDRRILDASILNRIHLNYEEDSRNRALGIGFRYSY